ncbi:nudix family hydrolase [Massarina eburnea CBS 473.64]|uniref:Nudix family hydrolase n=1 Tax=Massarina eburnea CBS 473.64 TaxID=1395130 RepID=A0A6A6RZQ0_9PLEO|nr:nudix family hydrolase [Massarina eburnea CBS 473.64]
MSQTDARDLVGHLKQVLLDLNAHPYPAIANPPETPKRASVALILRIQPHYAHPQLHPPAPASHETIDSFFAHDWVQHGDPELLFIKRATRIGDKWNGHVALPGGKRDAEDADDQVTAAREALEEVGIDLGHDSAIAVGNLPQRVVTTSWGKVPLMVLCPYLYLLTSPHYPSQRLQPTEVASTHWVPLRALQSPALRTHEYADVSARLARSELGIKRCFLQAMLSSMMFAAIRLLPANSTYCATIPAFIPEAPNAASQPPLLLWGLTLGVVSDLLEHIPPHNALELWTYPTFTNWDVRFVMWALSYRFRSQKALEMRTTEDPATVGTVQEVADLPGIQEETAPEEPGKEGYRPGEVGIAGLGVGRHWGRTGRVKMLTRGAAVNSMLEGYYPIVRKAVATALVGRIAVAALVATYLWRAYKASS